MRRVDPHRAWQAARAWALACAAGSCACESSAPASTRWAGDRPRSTAIEWEGESARPPVAADDAVDGGGARGTWVLHIGDSFVDASFSRNIEPRIRASGAKYVVDSRTSTYTTTWAYDGQLETWLSRRPTLVIVTLGANEVDIPAPQVHAGAVERLARRIHDAGASCVWTTPPLWHGETGVVQVIHDHCAPCAFFDSDAALGGGLDASERQPDHIHPNSRGGRRWAEAFSGWLDDHRDGSRPGWWALPFERR